LAGVFTPEDALTLVVTRGRLIEELPEGAMLAVAADEDGAAVLAKACGLSVAAVNGPEQCVLSGTARAVAEAERRCAADGIRHRRLPVTRGFHSALTDPALDTYRRVVEGVRLSAPAIPFCSDVTGTWITDSQATDPGYWAEHIRATVRFDDGLRALLDSEDRLLLEVGPGATLTSLARRRTERGRALASLPTTGRAGRPEPDEPVALLHAAARLWEAGAPLDWAGPRGGTRGRRVPLPTYPFEGKPYRLGMGPDTDGRRSAAPGAGTVEVAGSAHSRPDLPVPYAEPVDDLQRTVAALWEELLGYERVGIHDDFLQLGGDSLLMTRLAARLRETFPVELPLERVFRLSTVAQQAAAIEESMLAALAEMSDEEVARLTDDGAAPGGQDGPHKAEGDPS
ncbi:acyltransferase domain-containing protein, partial [Streptomyces sp. NPDC001020]